MRTDLTPTSRGDRPADAEHRAVLDHLQRWERRALVSHEQAESIRAFEGITLVPERRVPLIAEALGYLGAIMAVSAGALVLGSHWADLSRVQHLAAPAVTAVVTLGAGWAVRRIDEPAVERLTGVLWTISVLCVAGVLVVWWFGDLGPGQEPAGWAPFALGAITACYARLLQLARPCVPLQLALYGGTLTAFGGAGLWAIDAGWTWLDRNPGWFGVTMLALSVAWIAIGRTGVLEPRDASVVIGSVGAVIAPLYAMAQSSGFGLVLGVLVGVGLLVTSVATRNTVMLGAGALGLFGYLTGTIMRYLSDTAGAPIALLLSGLVLIGVAIVTMRLRRFTGPDVRARVG